MAPHSLLDFIRRLRRARSVSEGGHLTDVQLLERFVRQRDEAAFEVLVWRHGILVLNVARRMLRHSADVEDVFQATFLTLARKASAIRRGTSLSSWLYKVTYRIALRMRHAAARRERQEQFGRENVAASTESGDAELNSLLAEEVDRLPERYRAVVVLCYLQGTTTEEAARMLGCPRGTVLSRLSSARQRLRQRLRRRGIAPAVALAAVSFGDAVSAGPSVALVAGVVRAALSFAAGGAAVPMVSSQVAALAQGALQTMLWSKIKIVALMVCMIALVGTGSGWLARSRSAAEASPPDAERPVKKEGLPQAAPDLADKIKEEIAKIHNEIERLTKIGEVEEESSHLEAIDARLELVAAQDDLRLREEEHRYDSERKLRSVRTAEDEVNRVNRGISSMDEKTVEGKKAIAKLEKELTEARDNYRTKLQQYRSQEAEHTKNMRPLRKRVYQAEYKLQQIEVVQTRRREEYATRRQALFARLQQLEDKDLQLRPADRLHDVERKLDALRREVGELRRAVERRGDDARKKP